MSILYEKHELFPEDILIRNFVDKVGINEIIDSWSYLFDNKLITKSTKGVVNDLSNCELFMDMTGFKTLMAFLKNNDYLKGIKLAVICDNPKTIIFPILGEMEETELKIKPFATMKAAVDWIIFDPR